MAAGAITVWDESGGWGYKRRGDNKLPYLEPANAQRLFVVPEVNMKGAKIPGAC